MLLIFVDLHAQALGGEILRRISVEERGGTQSQAPMNVETVNGSVVLGLPSSARADLKILNLNGDFSSELPVTSTMASMGARSFRGKLGVGGGEISVRTVNGTIRLVRQPRV